MRVNVLFRLLAIVVILSLSACGRGTTAPSSSGQAQVVTGELRVVPPEAAPGQTVWIYLDRVEVTGEVRYAWTVNGEILAEQNASAVHYQVPQNARDAILVTVSISAQDYHQELTTAIMITGAGTTPISGPTLPPPDPLSCSSEPLSATILPYQGGVTGSGTVKYCQALDGKFAASVELHGLPPGGSYAFTLQSGEGEESTISLLKQVFTDFTQNGDFYRDFPLGVASSTGDLQGQLSVELLPGEYAFKFLLKDTKKDSQTVMNNDNPPSIAITQSLGFQKGITFISWKAGEFSDPAADQSLEELAATGANWIALVVTGYQENGSSKVITLDQADTPADDDVQHVIDKAKELGLHVMLKPHVDLKDKTWRGDIGKDFQDAAEWNAWFTSYRKFILHYADLAERNKDVIQIFCVGTELVQASAQEAEWQRIVQEVDGMYSGGLVYASNWDEPRRAWWHGLDYIGVDAYFPLATAGDTPTVEELKAAWQEPLTKLEGLHNEFDKPVLLTELGYRDAKGAHSKPSDYGAATVDAEEQAHLYQAALETLMSKNWLVGIYWWNWLAKPDQAAIPDYTPQGKPAEKILTKYYGSTQAPLVAYQNQKGSCSPQAPGGAGRVLFSTKTKDRFQATLTLTSLTPNHGYLFTLSCKEGDFNCQSLLPPVKECSTEDNGYCDVTVPVLTDATGYLESDIDFELPASQYDMKFFIKDPSEASCILLNNNDPGPFTVVK